MAKDVPLKIETLSPGKDDDYLLTSAKEIGSILRHIAEKGARVALYYGNKQDFILTTLLGIDSTDLWLEKSQNESDNKHIAESHKLVFVSSHLHSKVQFTANLARSGSYQGQPAFYLPLPANLYRLQRREYFRLMVPESSPLHCILATGKSAAKPSREFNVFDISCGGIGITGMNLGTELALGEHYPNCQIELPETGMINGSIEVKSLYSESSASGHTHKRAGCEFKDLDRQSLILLQRYVTHMQKTSTKFSLAA